MKRTLTIVGTFILVAAFATVVALADATGDFKVTGTSYGNAGDADGGDVAISGSVNHGAIQSGKTVNVNVNYEYSFEYQTTETVNGVTTTTIPARCPSPTDRACRSNDGSANWFPKIIQTPYSYTETHTFNGSNGMTSITAPTVEKGRLNPKGKITGYNWSKQLSIVPSAIVVPASLIPEGATLVEGSIQITKVTYEAFLKDAEGTVIADTVNSGCLFGCN
jgi:hypothetical protein